MKTEMLSIDSTEDKDAIRRVAQGLRDGAIVGLPTETVYGLAAKVDKDVLNRLDAVKGRASGKRYTLHIGSLDDLPRYVPYPTLQAKKLMRKVWPGPATIVFELDNNSLEAVKSALPAETFELLFADGTLGIRYPDNPVACAILAAAVAPVIAPSANPGSQAPALSAQDVAAYFDGRIEYIVDAPDACKYRLNSTVIKVGRGIEVLREGVFTHRQVLDAASVNILFVCTGNTCRSPMAEVLCRRYLAEKFECGLDDVSRLGYTMTSAGIAAFEAMGASRHAQQVGREKDAPLDKHRSRSLTRAMIQNADLIFGMNHSHVQTVLEALPGAAEKCFLLDASGAIADPAGYDIDTYRSCAEQIERSIQERMTALL
jgi:protein-tyrosine phosphatase